MSGRVSQACKSSNFPSPVRILNGNFQWGLESIVRLGSGPISSLTTICLIETGPTGLPLARYIAILYMSFMLVRNQLHRTYAGHSTLAVNSVWLPLRIKQLSPSHLSILDLIRSHGTIRLQVSLPNRTTYQVHLRQRASCFALGGESWKLCKLPDLSLYCRVDLLESPGMC